MLQMAVNWAPVYANSLDSMFFVMLTPLPAGYAELRQIATAANSVPQAKKRNKLVKANQVSTGFAVGIRDGNIAVLTTAHSLEHLFRSSRRITPTRVNDLYTVRVLCRHYENAFVEAGSLNPEVLNTDRDYAVGKISSIDCEHDLMLVSLPVSSLTSFGGGGVPCPGPHPALRVCEGEIDLPTNECLMVSWQEHKPERMSIGRLGARRSVNEISKPNLSEYNINLLEVQVFSGPGASGSPLMNGNGEVIGVMHAIHLHDLSHSYFISRDHVMEFLNRFTFDVPPPLVIAPPSPV